MDNFTLIISIMLVSGLMSLALTALYSTSKNEPAIKDWIAATLCFFSSNLIGAVHNQVAFPYFIFPGLTNALYLTGHALIVSGIWRYCYRRPAYHMVTVIFTLTFCSVFVEGIAQNYVYRLLLYYPLIILLCSISMLAIIRQQRHTSLTGFLPILWVSGLFSLQLVVRTISILLGEMGIVVPFLSLITQNGAVLVLLYIIAMSMSFAFLISWQKEESLRTFSVTDNLTQWFNRHALSKQAPELFARARANQQPFSIVVMDIDHFKQINDQFGHLNGDQVLVHITQIARALTPDAQLHVRLGGEEFMWLLCNTTEQQALQMAETVCQAIHQTPFSGSSSVTLSASFGIASSGADDSSWQPVLRRADDALYVAKNNGRNQCMVYRDGMQQPTTAATCQLA